MSETGIVPRQHHMETASATTDPDNANSGSFAYVLTAIVLVALIALGVALSGTVGALAGRALEGLGSDDLEGLVERYDGTGDVGGSGGSGATGSLSVPEALDLDLSPYSLTVDDGVSATAYAGVPDDVRSYVRGLLSADSEAQQELARQLNAAARQDDPASALQAAVDAASAGKSSVEGVAAPSFSDEALNQQLTEARQATIERWDAIVAEVKLLDTTGEISYTDLREADEAVSDKTSEAAEDLTEALQTAAQQ